jgi:hypothetical protein
MMTFVGEVESHNWARHPVWRVNVRQWVARLVEKYPQVESVHIYPFRCDDDDDFCGFDKNPADPYSFVVRLAASCYDESGQQRDQIEQRIAFDNELTFDWRTMYFNRPQRDGVYVWSWGPGEPPAEILAEEDEDTREGLLKGWPEGDMSRFDREWRLARKIYPVWETRAMRHHRLFMVALTKLCRDWGVTKAALAELCREWDVADGKR